MPVGSKFCLLCVRSRPIDPLQSIEAAHRHAWVHDLAHCTLKFLYQSLSADSILAGLLAQVLRDLFTGCARQVLSYLDLDLAEIPFTSLAFPLLLVRVIRFGRARGATLEAAVVVVRYKGLVLVVLRGA